MTVHERNRAEDFEGYLNRLDEGYGGSRQAFRERLPVQEFENDEAASLMLPQVEQLADRAVADGCCQLGLAQELFGKGTAGELERDQPVEPKIQGLVNFSHASRTEWRDNLIV